MKVIEFDFFGEFHALKNFRKDILFEWNIANGSHVDYINEKLKEFNAVYYREKDGAESGHYRKVEFASEEDYIHFCLKWN